MHDTNSQAMLNVKQGDSARKIYISLTDGGRPYKITEDCTARLRATTSNGAILFNDCTCPIKDNVIEYTLTNDTCKDVGIVECELTLQENTTKRQITSPRFSLIVEGVITSDGEIEATNEFTALTNALNEVDTLDASVSKVNDTATISITKKDGTIETATVKDGVDGKDGYTPIKGVDYFDGTNGKDGKDADTNLFANAVKGTASGQTIRVEDVSPVEHNITCKLTSDTITDFSTVKVGRYGKNLYDVPAELVTSKIYNGILVEDTNSKWFGKVNIDTLPDVFTVSTTIVCDNPGTTTMEDTSLRFYFYDNNKVELSKLQTSNKVTVSGTKAIITFDRSKVPEGTQYVGLMIRINDAGYTKDTQIEQGATVTDYEPYVKYIEYTPNSDGTVEGITSVYPTMTLLTDTEDATIHCEYNKDINKSLNSVVPTGESFVTTNGTVVSPNADFAEVAEWGDGNPNNENRIGYFVCADVPVDGIVMKKATSVDDVKGVTILAPAFAGNYTKDKLDANGNLLPKYSYVAVIGFVPVIDNGTCTVGGRCMPDDNGCAIPSSNNMGYQVVNRIDENRVLIIIEPNGDMVQRVKTKIVQIQEEIGDMEAALDSIIAIQNSLIGGDSE